MALISTATRRGALTMATVVVILLSALLTRSHRGVHRDSTADGAKQNAEPPVRIAIEREPENAGSVVMRTSASPEASQRQIPATADLSQEQLLEQVSRVRFANAGQQKEAFEFFWTPGLMLKELLQEDPIVVYPNE